IQSFPDGPLQCLGYDANRGFYPPKVRLQCFPPKETLPAPTVAASTHRARRFSLAHLPNLTPLAQPERTATTHRHRLIRRVIVQLSPPNQLVWPPQVQARDVEGRSGAHRNSLPLRLPNPNSPRC